jgi:hypothetical protein
MRFLAATLMLAAACGGPKTKHEGAIVNEGSDVPATCCCKTMPETSDKEIQPVYTMEPRMECSTAHGDCVDDVQCNGSQQASPTPGSSSRPAPNDNGVPPPPVLPSSK